MSKPSHALEKKQLPCPQCGTQSLWATNPFRPFCSKRCQNTDLVHWADEKYKVSDTLDEPSTSELDPTIKRED